MVLNWVEVDEKAYRIHYKARSIKNGSKSKRADTRLWIIEYIIEHGPGFSRM